MHGKGTAVGMSLECLRSSRKAGGQDRVRERERSG